MADKFIFKNKIFFDDITENTELPESDLCFQGEDYIIQFDLKEGEDEITQTIVKPGLHTFYGAETLSIKSIEFKSQNLLSDVTNTQKIVKEADVFFNNLEIYDRLKVQKSRKLLIYSDPGMGKTSTITQYCIEACEQDPGTVVIIWPTSHIEAYDVHKFLSKHIAYHESCTRLILIIEDIGGGEREGNQSARSVDSSLLDLLDGIGVTFKIPTLILSTTNYPQNLLSALADRPGRFDLMMKLNPPTKDERVRIVEFIADRRLSKEEYDSVIDKSTDYFSIAHWKEVVIRSEIHKKTLKQCIEELVNHKKMFNKGFNESSGGFGFG